MDRWHGGGRRSGRCFTARGRSLELTASVGSGAQRDCLGGAIAGPVQSGHGDHGRQPRLPGPHRRVLCRVPCRHGRGVVDHRPRVGHHRSADHLFGRRASVCGAVGGLGRRHGRFGRGFAGQLWVVLRRAYSHAGGVFARGWSVLAGATRPGGTGADRRRLRSRCRDGDGGCGVLRAALQLVPWARVGLRRLGT